MIGVLALQGDYSKHLEILEKLKISSCEIRYPHQLNEINGLIIPGGESTTMTDLIERNDLHNNIITFSNENPILGTCAGLIMMSRSVNDNRVKSLNILDIEVDRNAYGRQVNSFTDKLSIYIEGISKNITATFIRAPKINKMGKEIEIISSYNNEPVAVKQGIHMGLAFHPELDGITLFHEFIFVKQLNKTSHAA
jgi:5'-phosphate synthase pdxT subunit